LLQNSKTGGLTVTVNPINPLLVEKNLQNATTQNLNKKIIFYAKKP